MLWKILQLILRDVECNCQVDEEHMLWQIRSEWDWEEHLYSTDSQLAYSACGVASGIVRELWRSEPEGDRIGLFGDLGRLEWESDMVNVESK